MITVYGIPNCDTVKKARAWLTSQGLEHTFHDFKKHGVPAERLPAWCQAVGWEKLLNRQGTTWRKLGADVQAGACDAAGAQALMLANPSVVKRPVVEWQGSSGPITVGFDAPGWLEIIRK
jgi:arsenate reductase (glutaredoxin)